MSPTRVLIVDDSALIRKILSEILSSDPEIEVVGTANDPFIARDRIKELDPDVITLDVEMPRMDGLTFLANLMRLRPTPVVMISSLTEKGAEVTLRALEIGAVDFLAKPATGGQLRIDSYAEEVIAKVKAASRARVRPRSLEGRGQASANREPRRSGSIGRLPEAKQSVDVILPKLQPVRGKMGEKLIAIGASTGGTEAIREVLQALPGDCPPIVIVQHIPETFSASFARRTDAACELTVKEVVDGERIQRGHAYVAPGSHHFYIERRASCYTARLSDGPHVNRHRPAVDVLFRSVAQNVGPKAVGVVLTGMGDDGAVGLKEIRDAGGRTLVQDERSCVVYGMPKEAVAIGAAEAVVPLDRIARAILELVGREAVSH